MVAKKPRGCVAQTTKKYVTRNSPAFPANECPEGMIKKGKDGREYMTKRTSRDFNIWVLKKPAAAAKRPAAKKPAAKKPTVKKRCPNGSRRNATTGACVPTGKKPAAKKPPAKKKRCPNGSRRSTTTGACVPNGKKPAAKKKPAVKKKRCPNGSRRNAKTGICVPNK